MTDNHERIGLQEYGRAAPAVVAALRALGQAIDDSGLDKALTELIKVRASQINGCAFCLQYHLLGARKANTPSLKLDLVATWRDVALYTDRERAALAWTESLTRMAREPAADAVYEQVRLQFSAAEIAFLTAAIGLINAWNRIAGGLRFTPPV